MARSRRTNRINCAAADSRRRIRSATAPIGTPIGIPTENADTRTTAERQRVIPGGTNLIIKRDDHLCMESGFCGTRFGKIDDMAPNTGDTQVRSLVMAMVERCPSGAYVYSTGRGRARYRA